MVNILFVYKEFIKIKRERVAVKIKESGKRRGEAGAVCAVRCVRWVATPEELNIKNLVLRGF